MQYKAPMQTLGLSKTSLNRCDPFEEMIPAFPSSNFQTFLAGEQQQQLVIQLEIISV